MSTPPPPVDLSSATVTSLMSAFLTTDNLFWQFASVLVMVGVATSGIMYSNHKSNKVIKNNMIFYTVITPFVVAMAVVAYKGKGNSTVHTISNVGKGILLFLYFIMFFTNYANKENFAMLNRNDKDKKNRN